MRRFFGAIVGIGGLLLFAYGGIKYLTGTPFSDQVRIAQNITATISQCIAFGFIALVLGCILLFVSWQYFWFAGAAYEFFIVQLVARSSGLTTSACWQISGPFVFIGRVPLSTPVYMNKARIVLRALFISVLEAYVEAEY